MNLQEHIRKVLKEIRVPREERVQLYKDDNIIVVVPLTHRALQKYAHRCQWCINDDKGEWEDYHKGLHAVIIQRNPKKIKIGITGNPVPTEIFIMGRWDEGGHRFKDVCDILNYNFKDEVDMKDYFTTISNDINNFGTNIVYYSPNNELYDQEDNYLGDFNYKISDIPNVTPEVIKIMNEYLTKEEFERPDAPKINQQELDEYARTLKNARQQGVGLRFPKSAIKSNPSRFRPYNRKGVNESDLETKQNNKRIVCEKCGWSWDLSDGGDDPYTCHKCGNENHKEMSLQESIRRILMEEFNQLPKYLYHLTSDENYKNILMEGFLNPKYSKQSKRKKGIYLSDDISVAENYRFFYEPNEKVVLLKIKTSSLNEDSFYPDDYELQDFLDDGGWGVDEDIEYSRWYDVPWQLSLKWVNQIQYLEPIPISEIKKI
jgi:DNA-directed RNA polymerase subunit RPC12/RpoP